MTRWRFDFLPSNTTQTSNQTIRLATRGFKPPFVSFNIMGILRELGRILPMEKTQTPSIEASMEE